jgi:hypothetical protein
MSPSETRNKSPEAAPTQNGDATDTAVQATGDEQRQEEEAAQMIQRNYRGYRERRQLQGMGLDAATRWSEVCYLEVVL